MKVFLLTRLPLLFFAAAWLLVKLGRLFPGFFVVSEPPRNHSTRLLIEAGERGWQAIEFQELYQSAVEYLGSSAVEKLVVDKSKAYVPQVRKALKNGQITHYFYDPRTGSQELFGGFVEAVRLAVLFARYRVSPIVYLTDLAYRQWRCKSASVSAVSGVTVTFMMPKLVQPIFPHRRLVGPSLMPFSNALLERLNKSRKKLERQDKIETLVRFTGSNYEPRKSFLEMLANELHQTGHRMEIQGRELGSERVSDEEYWRRVSSALINITTAMPVNMKGNDWEWVPHLVYRYLEVLAAGSLLLAPAVPGVERYFKPGKHFVAFNSVEHAAEQARYFLDNPKDVEKIRLAGHRRACELISVQSFWVQIDTALGYEALTR